MIVKIKGKDSTEVLLTVRNADVVTVNGGVLGIECEEHNGLRSASYNLLDFDFEVISDGEV